MRLRVLESFAAWTVLALVAGAALSQNQGPTEHAMALLMKFRANKASVGYGAGVATLRGDLDSRAKPGKVVEATLTADLHFSDGVVLPKATVLLGEVTAVANHTRQVPESALTVDWTAARLPKKVLLPIAAVVRDAQGANAVHGADHSFGQNQLGATSNSGHAGDNNTTMNNSVLMNKQTGMPQLGAGMQMEPNGGHSLRVSMQGEDIVLRDGTKLVLVLFKDLAPAPVSP